jgi:hypothetical protein
VQDAARIRFSILVFEARYAEPARSIDRNPDHNGARRSSGADVADPKDVGAKELV